MPENDDEVRRQIEQFLAEERKTKHDQKMHREAIAKRAKLRDQYDKKNRK